MSGPSFAPMGIPVHIGKESDGGPDQMIAGENAGRVQSLTTTVKATVAGRHAQVLAMLTFGRPGGEAREMWDFWVELDLGSRSSWVFGTKVLGDSYPMGYNEYQPQFWEQVNELSLMVDDKKQVINYADGSTVGYTLWRDYVYLRPLRDDPCPPPGLRVAKGWFAFTFGVAHSITKEFLDVPMSGILGLARSRAAARCPTFLEQVRDILETSSVSILLSDTRGYVTFGRRAVFPKTKYPWCNYIPVVGEHWTVASRAKELNGVRYTYEKGLAELDTGAAFCYLDESFVKKLYSSMDGVVLRTEGDADDPTYFIPVDSRAKPLVRFEIGGQMFTLEHMYLPNAETRTFGNIEYHTGAIQLKTKLFPKDDTTYDGPDLIGRVALINMEIVLHMPRNSPHTVSWRRKDTGFTGPSLSHQQPK
ncbi:aspartic peptidase domain-containing protein [Mycena filopes]|nr:aspartic peptidase domain-containing protein [Mycena filopes]